MSEPTKKAPQIDAFLTSLSPQGISRQEAHRDRRCTWCGDIASNFRDSLSAKEYEISGFCQTCQDDVFGGKA